MRLAILIFTLAGILSACSDETNITAAQAVLENSLPIATDVEYRNVLGFSGEVVCGEYSAYNNLDKPKAPFQRFLVVQGKLTHPVGSTLYLEPSELDWAVFCSEDSAAALLEQTGIGLFSNKNKALAKVTADFSALSDAINVYYKDNHRFPSAAQGLQALVERTKIAPLPNQFRPKGYIPTIPTDPWGNPYIYSEEHWGRVKGSFELTTLGADGAAGGTGENKDVSSVHLTYLRHIAVL